jgi:hypothetical protein
MLFIIKTCLDTQNALAILARIVDGRTIDTRGIVQYQPFLVSPSVNGTIIERTTTTTTTTVASITPTTSLTQTTQTPISPINCNSVQNCSGNGRCIGTCLNKNDNKLSYVHRTERVPMCHRLHGSIMLPV